MDAIHIVRKTVENVDKTAFEQQIVFIDNQQAFDRLKRDRVIRGAKSLM